MENPNTTKAETTAEALKQTPDVEAWQPTQGETTALSDDRMAAARRLLEQTFVRLANTDERDNIYWIGSQADLMEMTYIAYTGCVVRHADGSPASMVELARHICARLHMCMPANPYKVAARARQRKGIRRPTYLERFCWMHFVAGIDDPSAAELTKMG